MKKIVIYLRNSLIVLAMMASSAIALPSPSFAASCPGGEAHLLTFPAWYNRVVDENCEIVPPASNDPDGIRKFAMSIAFNIAEIILQLVAYGTLVMIIKGGFDYMTANGEQAKMTSSKNSIRNAIVGMVIALSAVAIVRLVGSAL